MAEAVCATVDPELFFPKKGGSTKEAKRICKMCPVTAECLAYGMSGDDRYGIYGGTSERDRRKIKKAAKQSS